MFPIHINRSVFDNFRTEVTAEHINRGERKHCGACPVALAFNEALEARKDEIGDNADAEIEADFLTLAFGANVFSREVQIPITGSLSEFIQYYDSGYSVPAGGEAYIEKWLDKDGDPHYRAGIDMPESWRKASGDK